MVDLLAGRIQVMFEQPAVLLPHIRTEKIRALAAADSRRPPQLPDLPTAAEAGLPGYEVSSWFGLLAPRGTPRDIIMLVNAEVLKTLATKEARDAFSSQGLEPSGGSPEDFSAFIASESAKWSRAIKASGAKLD